MKTTIALVQSSAFYWPIAAAAADCCFLFILMRLLPRHLSVCIIFTTCEPTFDEHHCHVRSNSRFNLTRQLNCSSCLTAQPTGIEEAPSVSFAWHHLSKEVEAAVYLSGKCLSVNYWQWPTNLAHIVLLWSHNADDENCIFIMTAMCWWWDGNT